MRRMKKFASLMMLAATLSLGSSQAFAGVTEIPTLASGGGIEMPGYTSEGSTEIPCFYEIIVASATGIMISN